MRKRSVTGTRLWSPSRAAEPRLLQPGQLDYPCGLLGQQQQSRPARKAFTPPACASCQQWERAALGELIEQPLSATSAESQQSAAERYLARLWSAHREHFGQGTRSVPRLMLSDELRSDTRGQYLPEHHLIAVRASALTRHVLVHEACHAWTTQNHGPQFAAGMLYLMEREFARDPRELLAMARSMGLHIGA